MTDSTSDALQCIAAGTTRASPRFHPDGTTPETPTWIWSVAVGGQLNRSPLQRRGVPPVPARPGSEGRPDPRPRGARPPRRSEAVVRLVAPLVSYTGISETRRSDP